MHEIWLIDKHFGLLPGLTDYIVAFQDFIF